MSVAIETRPGGPDELGREPVGLVSSPRFGAPGNLILQDTPWGWETPIDNDNNTYNIFLEQAGFG